MQRLFYNILIIISKFMGVWLFIMFSWLISACFFLFSPFKVYVSIRFYQSLFPGRSRFYHICCSWRQYQNFKYIFLDRLLLKESNAISYTSKGFEHIEKQEKSKAGGIILMSHMGNWEIAAHLLKKRLKSLRLLLYMGSKYKEQIERIQKDTLSQNGIRIISSDKGGGSSFELVEGLNFLKNGGFVSLTGDVVWNENQRVVPVKFLGHEVFLPMTPHILALLSGAPIFIFFSFRIGRNRYQLTATAPIYVKAGSRSDRDEAIGRSAQKYADIMEQTLGQYFLQWYHFAPFLGKKLKHEIP